jgi:hypothetical protein
MSINERFSLSYRQNKQGEIVLLNPDRKTDMSLVSSYRSAKLNIATI